MNAREDEIIRTKKNEIWIDDQEILRVKAAEGVEIDLREAEECFRIYRTLLKGRKACQLIDGRVTFTMTREARDYAAKHGPDFFIASAIVSNKLAVRMVVNFFNNFYPNVVPFRMFPSEEKAVRWLLQFRKQP